MSRPSDLGCNDSCRQPHQNASKGILKLPSTSQLHTTNAALKRPHTTLTYLRPRDEQAKAKRVIALQPTSLHRRLNRPLLSRRPSWRLSTPRPSPPPPRSSRRTIPSHKYERFIKHSMCRSRRSPPVCGRRLAAPTASFSAPPTRSCG